MDRRYFSINEDFMKNYNEESDEGYFIEVDIQYPKKLHEYQNYLPFSPGKMKLGKIEKLVINLPDKTEYVIYIRNLKQAWINFELINRGLILKRVHRIVKFNKKDRVKPYIDMNEC